MEQQDIAVIHCGICECIVKEEDIPTHSCIQSYPQFFVDDNFYIYPVTAKNRIVRRNEEGNLVFNSKVPTSFRENIPATEIAQKENRKDNRRIIKSLNYDEELLILSVQERRSLWDYTIPVEQQCLWLTKTLWDEVSEILGVKLAEKLKESLKIYTMPIGE